MCHLAALTLAALILRACGPMRAPKDKPLRSPTMYDLIAIAGLLMTSFAAVVGRDRTASRRLGRDVQMRRLALAALVLLAACATNRAPDTTMDSTPSATSLSPTHPPRDQPSNV